MRKKILLVEDDPIQIDIYETVLKKDGFAVENFKTVEETLKRFEEIKEGKKEKPDLVLLDLLLADFNGIYLLEKAKKDPQLKDLPIFVLTNYSDPELDKYIKELKPEKYILKTAVVPSQLVKIIKEWFEERK